MLLHWIKNTAGRERYVLTISGAVIVLIIAWVLGLIFMPKRNLEKENDKILGVWYNKRGNGFTRMEIKQSGYFYFYDVSKNGKSKEFKGVITETILDTFALIAFNNDTLFFHKIVVLTKEKLLLKSIKDSFIINFEKEK